MNLLEFPRDILFGITSYCVNEESTAGWKIMLGCKYLRDICNATKPKWYNRYRVLCHSVRRDDYETALSILDSDQQFSVEEADVIVQYAVMGGNERMIRLCMERYLFVDDTTLLKTALVHNSCAALKIIQEHVENDNEIYSNIDKTPDAFRTRTDKIVQSEAFERLLSIGETCYQATNFMSPEITTQPFKVFWRIASNTIFEDADSNFITCTEDDSFIHLFMFFACQNGKLSIAKFIDDQGIQCYNPSYCLVAIANAQDRMLVWLQERYTADYRNNSIEIYSSCLYTFFTRWTELTRDCSLHKSYSKCFDILIGDPRFFRIDVVEDNVFRQIALLRHPRATEMFIYLFNRNKKHGHCGFNTQDVIASENVAIIEFVKEQKRFNKS